MALCNPFPDTLFTVKKKTKILIKIKCHSYLAIKYYIVQYKLQNGAQSRV